MGSKDEEIILIHATMHYNEYGFSINTIFFCFPQFILLCHLHSFDSSPHLLLSPFTVSEVHSIPFTFRKDETTKQDRAQEPPEIVQMILLFPSIGAIIVIIPNSCLLCRDADV